MTAAPSIPETLESGEETAAGSVHPRQFIEEYDHPLPPVLRLQQLDQLEKCLHPRFWLLVALKSMVEQREIETFQLGLHPVPFILLVHWRHAGMLEGESAFQSLLDEEGLAYSPSAIYSDELGSIAVI